MMSAFAQKLGRLRCTYSVLSGRLGDKCNYSQWLNTLSERKSGAIASFTHVNAISKLSCSARSYIVATHRDANTEYGDNQTTTATDVFPEVMRENDYAHNLFLSSSKYSASVMSPSRVHAYVTKEAALKLLDQDWTQLSNEEVLSAVKKLSYNIEHSNEIIMSSRYENAIEELSLRCQKLADDKLIVMMKHLIPFRQRFERCKVYQNLCMQLDNECLTRFMTLPINNILLLCDMMYGINRKNSQYVWSAIRKLGNKPKRLSPQQLIQVLFFLNICRRPPVNMYELEYRLEQCLDELSINELGVATLGFFKTGSMIRSGDLLNRIMHKTINEIENADSVSIGGIVKLIRYSMQLTEIKTLRKLLDAIIPHEPRLTLMTLTHLTHACARVALYRKEFMDRVIGRLNNEIKTARLKDFERLIFVLATLNIDASNNIYHNVIEELRATWDTSRRNEIIQYPHAVSRIMGFMSYINIYPTDLIKRIMSPEFIHKICVGNYNHIPREYCVLDYSLRLEVPEYDGPFLKPEQCNFVAKKYFLECSPKDTSKSNVLLTTVLQTCQEMYNSTTNITACRLLPHYATSDIVFCLDEQNQLVPSEKFLSSFGSEEIKRVDKETSKNVKWIALVVTSHGVLIRGTNLPVGFHAARIRQLSIIGYIPIMITQPDWSECRTPQERHNYIRNLISMSIVSNMTNT